MRTAENYAGKCGSCMYHKCEKGRGKGPCTNPESRRCGKAIDKCMPACTKYADENGINEDDLENIQIIKPVPWDFSKQGKRNIFDRLQVKMNLANRLLMGEEKETIIKVDDYELTILCWALDLYINKANGKEQK